MMNDLPDSHRDNSISEPVTLHDNFGEETSGATASEIATNDAVSDNGNAVPGDEVEADATLIAEVDSAGSDTISVQPELELADVNLIPGPAAEIGESLEAAGTGEETEVSDVPQTGLRVMDSSEFAQASFELEWLVEGILVAKQCGVIGGPTRSHKTSVAADLAISLATGTSFLGHFKVPQARRVLIFSGETVGATLRDLAERVCKARGMELATCDNIAWGLELPQLDSSQSITDLSKLIFDLGIEVVFIDPFYLCLGNVSPTNMFKMGPVLQRITEACRQAGATLVLVHHTKKNLKSKTGMTNLNDLAFVGLNMFCRQWIMLNPREEYDAANGHARLWMRIGGAPASQAIGESIFERELLEPSSKGDDGKSR